MHSDNTMFLIVCSAMVLFMTPGLAFFYGGLVRASSVVSMIMMSFSSIALIGVLWVIYGYAIAFPALESESYVGVPGVIGIDFSNLNLEELVSKAVATNDGMPLAFSGFQATFAIITVALISGAIADRAKFGAWMVYAGLWATLVYFPITSWVFNTDGWLIKQVGLLDFAGGTVVEVASGASALALALVVGKRFGFTKGMHAPHNVPLTLIGAGILWFGWFGFNAGSELSADGAASLSFVNTFAASVGGLFAWVVFDKIKHSKPTAVGAASGAVAGMVAITPACGFVTPIWAVLLGVLVGVVCAFAIEWKYKLHYDDSLDVVGIHLVAGIIGTLYIGLVGHRGGSPVGLFLTGDWSQLGKQAIGVLAIGGFAYVVSWVLGYAIDRTMGFRISSAAEIAGVDEVMHGELAYSKADPRWGSN